MWHLLVHFSKNVLSNLRPRILYWTIFTLLWKFNITVSVRLHECSKLLSHFFFHPVFVILLNFCVFRHFADYVENNVKVRNTVEETKARTDRMGSVRFCSKKKIFNLSENLNDYLVRQKFLTHLSTNRLNVYFVRKNYFCPKRLKYF